MMQNQTTALHVTWQYNAMPQCSSLHHASVHVACSLWAGKQGTVAAATPEADGMQDACLSGRGPRGDATCMLLFLLELSGE